MKKLRVAQALARDLAGTADRIEGAVNSYAAHLHEVDRGFRIIIENAPTEAKGDPAALQTVCTLGLGFLAESAGTRDSSGRES